MARSVKEHDVLVVISDSLLIDIYSNPVDPFVFQGVSDPRE